MVRWRGSWPAVGCILLAACAAQAKNLATTSLEGPMYDPAAEWANANRDAQAPVSQPAVRARAVSPVRLERTEPAFELRPFTRGELERIARVQDIVREASRRHEVAPDLVNGIIWVESRFDLQARSEADARGLMQLLPSTGREIARTLGLAYRPYDPEFNIQAGTYYVARLIEHFGGNMRLALAAYNIGPANVDAWLRDRVPLPSRSEAYVDNVFNAARAFRAFEGVNPGEVASR